MSRLLRATFVPALLLAAASLAGCGGDEIVVGPAAVVELVTGGGQIAAVATAVGTPPSFRVKDAAGRVIAGAQVRFTVEGGGGSVTPELIRTDGQGVAAVGSWTLGSAPGQNILRARVEGLSVTTTVSATAIGGTPPSIQAASATTIVAAPGQAITPPPTVEVKNGSGGAPLAGVTVTFQVTAGGGTVTGGTVVTNALGRATVGSWTAGPAAGTNRLSARLESGDNVVFTAQAVTGPPALLEAAAPVQQNGFLRFMAPKIPRVIVKDANGNPIPNIPVTFALVGVSDAQLTGTSAVSDTAGVAAPGDWRLGTAPTSIVAATLPDFPGLRTEFRLDGTATPFVIDVRLLTTMTPNHRDAFAAAAARWMQVITGDLPDVQVTQQAGRCESSAPAVNEVVDDVVIYAITTSIDGPGGVLGSAGPCVVRTGSVLTALGSMRFDVADLANLERTFRLNATILHEMGHVLGLGTNWQDKGLTQDIGTNDPIYIGQQGLAIWPSFNLGYLGRPVPLENTGGAGTAGSHWRETVFGNELMTGIIAPSGQSMPLSRMTIASLKDLGFTADLAQADAFAGNLRDAIGALSLPAGEPIVETLYRAKWGVTPSGEMVPMSRP